MSTYDIINTVVWDVFAALMLYQILFVIIGLFKVKRYKPAKKQHEYAILIAGRNEEAVIGQLIDSIKNQNYDMTKIKIFVCADNCSINDKTAEIARQKGAIVYERHDLSKIGKCYPLDLMLKNMVRDFPDYHPEGFFVFDADNILDKNYILKMNDAFDSGEKIITSYRASKNFDQSLMAMGSSVGFIRECRFLHAPRNLLSLSTFVSGTGFLISSEVFDYKKGWNYNTISEDYQLTCDKVIKGTRVAYCDDAIFYDEQPTTLKQTYRQRLRWQKGCYIIFGMFLGNLLFKMFNTLKFTFFDFIVHLGPIPLCSTSWALFNGLWAFIECVVKIIAGEPFALTVGLLLLSLLKFFALLYLGFFIYGSLSVLKDWKRIKTTNKKKFLSMLTYPIFMISLIPIPFIPLFRKIEWKPIKHSSSKTVSDIEKQ